MKCLTCNYFELFYTIQDGEYKPISLGRCKNEYKRGYTNRVMNVYSEKAGECKWHSGSVAVGQIEIEVECENDHTR